MLLRLDLRLRREAHAYELALDRVAELRFRREQEVVFRATEHAQRRDHPRLRREQQRVARTAGLERLDVVRDHALQVVGGVRSRDAEERPRASGNGRRRDALHAN